MNKKTSETLATALSFLQVVPSFNGALLFTDEISDVTKFNVSCNTNASGRMVYSLNKSMDLKTVRDFQKLYKEVHGNDIRELKKHDINSENYPVMGADYKEDISPATIARLLRVTFDNSNELGGVLPSYIMRLAREVKRWEGQFADLHTKTVSLRKVFENILESSFIN